VAGDSGLGRRRSARTGEPSLPVSEGAESPTVFECPAGCGRARRDASAGIGPAGPPMPGRDTGITGLPPRAAETVIGDAMLVGRSEQTTRRALIASKYTEGACWMRDPGGPLLRSPAARRAIRHPRGAARRPHASPGSPAPPAPLVPGAADSHGTSAGLGWPYGGWEAKLMRRREFIAVAPG
jgi:hypothetical protein